MRNYGSMYYHNSTGHRNISYITERKKFTVCFVVNHKHIFGGMFKTLEEAVKAKKKMIKTDERLINFR